MKTKTLLSTVIIMMAAKNAFSQGNNWRISGNNNTDSTNFIGTTINKDFNIKVNNKLRINVDADDTTRIYSPLKLANSNEDAFIWFPGSSHPNTCAPFGASPVHDDIHVTTGILTVMKHGLPGQPFGDPNVKMGIGTEDPQDKLHLYYPGTTAGVSDVYTLYTNSGNCSNKNGFEVGINAAGFAELKQRRNLKMDFYTNNIQRATILANGRTGINIVTPSNRLEITSALGDPYFPALAGGSSGLRFTNLTTATTPLAVNPHPVPAVLTVDVNGDVILVKEGTGIGSGGIAQNGLNNPVPTIDELGGPLLHPTNVTTFVNKDMAFNGNGQFLIADQTTGINRNAANLTSDYKMGIFNDTRNRSLEVHNVRTTNVSTQVYGILNTVDADAIGFSVTGSSNGAVGNALSLIGVSAGASSRTYLGTPTVYGVLSGATNGGNNYAFNGTASGTALAPGGNNIGIDAEAYYGTAQAMGGLFRADNSTLNKGIQTEARNLSNSTSDNFGLKAFADGGGVSTSANSNIGVVGFSGYDVKAKPQIGVAGIIDNSNLAIPVPSIKIAVYGQNKFNGFAGYFDGDLFVNGPASGTGIVLASDPMFKTNIDTITNAASIIKQLKPKSFYFDTTNAYGIKFSNQKQLGFLATDVQSVLPYLVGTTTKPVKKDSLGNVTEPAVTYKTLNYNAFFALYAKGFQEMQKTIDSMRTVMATCCASVAARTTNSDNNNSNTNAEKSVTQIPVQLSDNNIISLSNPIPNPNTGKSVINYNIPVSFNSAQIIFTTTEGRLIKTVDIKEKGQGQLDVDAKDLSDGIYIYTLTVDNKIIDTKKMVKSE